MRPIITLDGGHEVNDVFLDNVKVPVENRIYEENQGWTCAKFLLLHERSGIAGVGPLQARRSSACARHGGVGAGDDGAPLIDGSASSRRKLAELEIDLTGAGVHRAAHPGAARARGKGPGPESSLLKIKGTEIQQRLTELTLEAAGHYGAPYLPRARPATTAPIGPDYARGAADAYFNMRKTSIYGGSNEIQRNIIAKMVLGL